MAGWDDFPDADDQWSDFPDAQPKPRAKPKAAPETLGDITRPVDGDTLRLTQGPNVRLLGVDAPELGQPGWQRDYSTVDIGEASTQRLKDYLANLRTSVGPIAHRSFGRPVAPVDAGGSDLGQSFIRSGGAFAAPDYLAEDPDRRFGYMQAERLARLNQLGVHDTFQQMPDQHRDNPQYVAPRETVAQFFDTPTPQQGMRPEVEQQYYAMLNDFGVPSAEIVTFARDNGGFIVDAAEIDAARQRSRREGQPIGFSYSQPPQVLTDLGDGATGAAIRGAGSGFLAGGLDEAGAVADMLGATSDRESVWNSERRLADIWANNRAQNASILGYDETAFPVTSTVSTLGGAILQPFPGGKFNSARKLGAWGAGYGGAEGFLGTEGGLADRAKGAAIGAPIGFAAGTLGGKAIEAAAPYVSRGIGAAASRLGIGQRGRLNASTALDTGTVPSGAPEGNLGDQWADFPDAPRTMGMDAEAGASVSAPTRLRDYLDMSPRDLATRLNDQPTEAQLGAIASNVTPDEVLPIPSNQIADVDEAAAAQAGRFAEARPVDERGELQRRTIRAFNGQEVPKVGPVDLTGWLRTQGGLVDQGGELSAMGVANAARKGMEHVGQEARFGPMVNNESGLTLDEAALRAWEQGYFPDHAERPSINEFLDAVRETYEGTNRRFLPDDMPEVERFDAARSDRYALEQEIAERGPLVRDMSQPADAQPLPPVQAYEDWGPSPPDFAGNINLAKLESPQDISRALTQAERRVGFDAATRGKVTQAETARLAAELNMTPEKLLSRRKGQAFNAEEALAARQILAKSGNELVNMAKRIKGLDDPGDEMLARFREAWVRHVAIQEQVSGATAEAGRAMQQFRMAASSRGVRGDVLSALVRGGGGKDNLKDAAEALIDAAETSPGVFNAVSQKAAQPKWRHRISELYINFLLSNPATHVVNMTSNALTSMAQIPEFAVGAMIGGGRQLAARGSTVNRITGSEVGRRAFGLIQGTREGARLFSQALRSGEASDFVSKVEGEQYKAIPGLAGEAIRIPTRFLTAEDELFKGIARRMELNGQAARIAHREGLRGQVAAKRIQELVNDPTDEMFEQALDYGRYLTFQRKLGPFAQKVSGLTNDSLVAKIFLPFVRTPTNLLKFATERSPAAPLLKEWRKDFMAGGERRDLALARMLIGTGFGAAIYEGALKGYITGSAPTDPKKSRLLYADGWKPYSIKIGDTYYSYKRLDPFATTLGVAADMATLPEGMSERQREDKTTLLVASIMGNLASKTWLSGVSDVVSALHEPDRYADNLTQRVVASFLIPNFVAGVARTMDPVQRERETYGEELRSRLPGMSQDLMPRRDVWGREIVNQGGLGPDWISPVYISSALQDPVNHELMQTEYAPGYPSRSVGGRELSPEEYDRYLEVSGKASHAGLLKLVTMPAWQRMDDEQKVKSASKVVSGAREAARERLFGGGGDEWDQFEDEGGEWDAFEDAPTRNVLTGLQQAIPGVEATSGWRNDEYQEAMRARGYRPAENSAHKDGAALDLLPPRGRSLSWLRDRVTEVEPEAELLIEGDHLHAVFPEYYSAPVLGGARAAGLVNPNEAR